MKRREANYGANGAEQLKHDLKPSRPFVTQCLCGQKDATALTTTNVVALCGAHNLIYSL